MKSSKNSKYSNVLTVLLIIIIVVVIGLLGFLGYQFIYKTQVDNDAHEFVANYENQVQQQPTEDGQSADSPLDDLEQTPNGNGQSGYKPTYKGFDVVGSIDIPKTDVHYPILAKASAPAIAVAVGVQYGPGPNQVGNTVIAGHNYRNGQFFSNNKKLAIGDVIYITDNSGTKLKYTIYNKYETTPEDTDYMVRDTQGTKEISLTTCTDDSKARTIIWARAEE